MLSERLVVCRGGGLQGLVYALLDLIRYVKSELGRLSGNKENVQIIHRLRIFYLVLDWDCLL